VASAEAIYVDPSALLKLYVHESESRAMIGWRSGRRGALPITHHSRAEVVNGICLAAFRRRDMSPAAWRDALASFEEDFAAGRYVQADILWRSALRRTIELSRDHTPELGCRTLDVLHVACALELGLPGFLTFDVRQRKLASAVGLKVVALRGK
jgi:predicted nucleic acid-binding protein